ncbi:MAG: [FeFe] hydrogenase H-cluster radical SAM maturase HydE [Clostridiales Family XIII bacterium]|jgi:biotin synthase|nr:[FeFe] hydrogenase H-cluster radical SAM maturase HydE [Clostridiales Family XIII bacterium]
MSVVALINKLEATQILSKDEFIYIIDNYTDEDLTYLQEKAVVVRKWYYDNHIYIRGLIEFTNYCVNDCYYCGIRRSNTNASRYRLTKDEILECSDIGYELGFRTYVLQGGEDPYYTDDLLEDIVKSVKEAHPDCAITLSIGERSFESYKRLFDAGADRYLLRHETANDAHYRKLHPDSMSLTNRKQCLQNLKDIGYQVGSGFMVGSPYQTSADLAEDLIYLKSLQPDMVGIGPFISHADTPYKDEVSGMMNLTLLMIGLLRLMLRTALLPSTTALGTIDPQGREQGILSGANVVMPNLSPQGVRDKYLLYDNKICTGDEAAECRFCMQGRMESIGYQIVETRGDAISTIESA